MPAYEQIVFMQGDDADKPIDILYARDKSHDIPYYTGPFAESVAAAFEYLKQWDYGDGGEVRAAASPGQSDDAWEEGGYRLSAHCGQHYIGLERILADDSTCGTCGRTWHSVATPTPGARCPFEYDHEEEGDVEPWETPKHFGED